MSTSLLNRAFGCRDYRYKSTRYEGRTVIFSVEPKKKMFICPDCKTREVVRKGKRMRKIRGVPIGRKIVWLEVAILRFDCKKCGKRFEVFPPLPNATEATPKAWNDMLAICAK